MRGDFDHAGNPLRVWDDETETFTDYTVDPPETRPYTPEELEGARIREAESQARVQHTTLTEQLAAGVAMIQQSTQAAQEDAIQAESLRVQATQLSQQIATQITAVTAFKFSVTYQPTEMAQLKSVLVDVMNRQKLIVDATAAMYQYRQAVDNQAVQTNNCLEWVARLVSGALTD